MPLSRLIVVLSFLGLTGCDGFISPEAKNANKPTRIVSLDFCADQYVLKLVDRENILAVSPDATRQFSYMREEAKGMPVARATAEDVLILKPDLVVRSYGGGPNAEAFFARAGVTVLNLGWTNTLDDVKSVIQKIADQLHESERGKAIVAEMDRRLAALQNNPDNKTALYMTPAGATTGPGSLVDEALSTAGLENFQQEPGWRSLPLERLAYEQPDLVAAAFFNSHTNHKDAWSAMRHPVARNQMRDRPIVALDGAWTACGGWFLMDAIEALANGGETNGAN